VGGVIPPQDYDELYKDGAVAIFGPGTAIPAAALKILEILERQGGTAANGAREAEPEASHAGDRDWSDGRREHSLAEMASR